MKRYLKIDKTLKPLPTLIFLGRKGLPFRRHADDYKHLAQLGEHSTNSVGLF